ncbi:hypothetical protein BAE44_0021227 [Dichanthelium oligosanthes]|uniref:Uncharacterized protein n=1 Tax=Dichanthelium oligosanthes TaxID=888268 RepID=A0A1E5UY90_9POAL|nr:hypothetical protein BAE44_0021227 [Dichanthelium oligosanthes]
MVSSYRSLLLIYQFKFTLFLLFLVFLRSFFFFPYLKELYLVRAEEFSRSLACFLETMFVCWFWNILLPVNSSCLPL